MTDILDRLRLVVRDETQATGALHQDAADEIEQLREENRKLRAQLEAYTRLAEPEC